MGAEFHGISAANHAGDSPRTYEKLYEKLQDHELFLRREESKRFPAQIIVAATSTNLVIQIITTIVALIITMVATNNGGSTIASLNPIRGDLQPSTIVGHVENICRSQSQNHFKAKANYMSSLNTFENPWILDSGASHHITATPQNLQAYNGMEQVFMGDSKRISITHTGSTHLNT